MLRSTAGCATPGADIVELCKHGLRHATWDDLDLTDHWRRFMHDPGAYLRHIPQAQDT